MTAINLGDLDGNPLTVADPSWRPLIVTPPFPEYTSGHSTFSGAAAAILTAEFGDNYAFTTGTSSTNPAIAGVTRSFSSFTDAAEEAGRSRSMRHTFRIRQPERPRKRQTDCRGVRE